MTRILRLLLIAAIALPYFGNAAAQEMLREVETKAAVALDKPQSSQDAISKDETKPLEMKVAQSDANQSQKAVNAAENSRLKVDYFGNASKGSNSNSPKLKASLRAATPPASANVEEWNISTNFYNVGASGFITFRSTVKVAIDGNDIYIQGLDYWFADAWVQGTINGNTAVFETGQLFGSDDQGDDYFVGFDTEEGNVADVVFIYSATAHKLTLPENMVLLIGADTNGGYWAYHINTVIAKEYVEPPVPVDVADGTSPNQIVPVYGAKYNSSTTSQMIYPASMLTSFQEGQTIKSVTFYTNDNGIKFSGGQITATIGTTTSTYFTGRNTVTISGSTTGTVVPTQNSKTLKIEFDNPITYTAGSNIVVQLVNTTTGTASATTWFGVAYTGNTQYYSYSSKGRTNLIGNDAAERLQFLPKATFELQNPPVSLTDELDFEVVEVGQTKTLTAYVENANSEAVNATVTTASPFSAPSTVTLQPGANRIDVTFTPTEPNVYNGNLAVDVNGSLINIPLKGIGFVEGPQALRDSTFFAGIDYKWTDKDGNKHTSNLNEIATDPDQMIAMIREVYTNRTIPGNYKRGYTTAGGDEAWNTVNYAGVGTITATIESSSISYAYANDYGWNIKGNLESGSSSNYLGTRYGTSYYCYMDSTQYKPYNEGVTLLLVEMVDDFNKSTMLNTEETEPYNQLRDYISNSIKSIRVVTEAKRTGTGFKSGTLFKIDCDKMNKFYLMAKGQLRWIYNSIFAKDDDGDNLTGLFSANPCYIYNNNSYNSVNGFFDNKSYPLFYNMFEEFSPVANDAATAKGDIYQDLVNMDSFGVEHDCMGVPYMGHQFMMYGDDSEAADCQDVRDLMFFIPDYRMMKWSGRESHDQQKFMNYNTTYAPTMGLYVIRQDEITPTTQAEAYYRLQLNWRTNLDSFLPSDEQEFNLYQVVVDEETGVKTYVPVYYRDNAGNYTDANGNPSASPVPVVLQFGAGATKNYPNVWVERMSYGQQVTYVIQGRDTGHFLSLQMSNEMSYLIPGTDPAEKVLLQDATHYSRFNPQNEKNCYSNKMHIGNHAGGMKAANLEVNTTVMTLKRMLSSTDANPVTVAEAVVASKGSNSGTLSLAMFNQSPITDYPNGKQSGFGAGYHTNESIINFSIDNNGYVNFGNNFTVYDNFTVDVSKNEHPSQYIYKIETNYTDETTSNNAYSNSFRVPVYKTSSTINGVFTKDQIDEDNAGGVGVPENVEFGEQVQYSSKTEILRYDVYRWNEGDDYYIINVVGKNDTEEDLPPDGIAGNQGESYTISMNEVGTEDYYTGEVGVSETTTTATATFVDYVPGNSEDAAAYVYAPVVETFTTGKDINGNTRTDYNTYGGPLQSTAVGRMAISIADPGPNENERLMSSHTWEKNGKTFTYYNVRLNIDSKLLPAGYNIYKIRAWRTVEGVEMGEEYSTLNGRGAAGYCFEDITYPDYDLNDPYVLGSKQEDVTVTGADGQPHTYECWKGTFGAEKLEGAGDEMDVTMKVRIYFTKENNLPQTQSDIQGAPRLLEETIGDGKYYIMEAEVTRTFQGGVPTGIDTLDARQITGVKYYNAAGIESDKPFQGVNIVVTRYNDGSTTTTKILK